MDGLALSSQVCQLALDARSFPGETPLGEFPSKYSASISYFMGQSLWGPER